MNDNVVNDLRMMEAMLKYPTEQEIEQEYNEIRGE